MAVETMLDFQRSQKYTKASVMMLVSVLLLTTSSMILTTVLLLKTNFVSPEIHQCVLAHQQERNITTHSTTDPSTNLTIHDKLKLVTRLEWLAQPPKEAPNLLPIPVPYVILHHTSTENCSLQAQCIFHVRKIQQFHIESKNWWDIAYNFLVGGDGEAYEGRGWKAEGAHTYRFNSRSIGIAFIGNFNTFKPPQQQIEACKLLIAKGVELGYIQKNYKLLAARQLQITQSPGAALYKDIKTWDHWAKEI